MCIGEGEITIVRQDKSATAPTTETAAA